jgi:hypothetical protein
VFTTINGQRADNAPLDWPFGALTEQQQRSNSQALATLRFREKMRRHREIDEACSRLVQHLEAPL